MNTATQPWSHVNDVDKREAIRLLAMGLSPRRIATRLGRTTEMLYEWAQHDPAFARALNALAASKDNLAEEFQLRVRRLAGTMLDEIELMATDAGTPAMVKKDVLKTFFADVYNPTVQPRVAATTGPVVFVNAEQAALLFTSPPMNGGGAKRADEPRQGQGVGGAAGPTEPGRRAVNVEGAGGPVSGTGRPQHDAGTQASEPVPSCAAGGAAEVGGGVGDEGRG